MKKIIPVISLAALLGISAAAASADNVRVVLDGKRIKYDVPPQIINDSTMVPVRATFEAMGMEVSWDEEKRLVTAVSDTNRLEITINSDTIKKNGKKYKTDTPALIVEERTLIPLRAVSELSDYEVEWNGDTYTVTLTSKQADDENTDTQESGEESADNENAKATPAPASTPKASAVSGNVTISETKAQVYVGDTYALTASSDNENDEFLWSSSDKTIAAVDQYGIVSAKYPGTCRIFAESRISGKRKTCTVSVGYQNTSLRFPAQSKAMNPGQIYTPKLLISPEDEKASLKWETSDKNVATVKNGTITAKSAGTAIITAKTALEATAEFTVTVNPGGVARLEIELDSPGAAPGKNAEQGAPVGINIFNKSDTDIVILPDAHLVRSDKSEYELTLAKFNKNSKVVSEMTSDVKVNKGAHRVVSYAIKNDGPPEGFAFKEGDKISIHFNCGGIEYTGVVDKYGRITISALENDE